MDEACRGLYPARSCSGSYDAVCKAAGEPDRTGTFLSGCMAADQQLDLSSNTSNNMRVQAINDDIDESKETSVASVVVQYALSTSASAAPSQGWSANAPPWEDGKYMWQKNNYHIRRRKHGRKRSYLPFRSEGRGRDGAQDRFLAWDRVQKQCCGDSAFGCHLPRFPAYNRHDRTARCFRRDRLPAVEMAAA